MITGLMIGFIIGFVAGGVFIMRQIDEDGNIIIGSKIDIS